jgi:hypothetical protein
LSAPLDAILTVPGGTVATDGVIQATRDLKGSRVEATVKFVEIGIPALIDKMLGQERSELLDVPLMHDGKGGKPWK